MVADNNPAEDAGIGAPFPLPRVTIKFCTQCKWNLRAAYFAQELLSTFSTSLGEVALQPSSGGTFIVEIFHTTPPPSSASSSSLPTSSTQPPIPAYPAIHATTLWDRATDGGFPETKELKRRVRDVIEPGRNLGHVDRDHARPGAARAVQKEEAAAAVVPAAGDPPHQEGLTKEACADCN